MRVLGLTGPSGSGKGFFEEILFRYGVPFLDTDALYHSLVNAPSACTEELECAFGGFVIAPGGALDRKALAKHVFCGGEEEKSRLALLNRITHKYVLEGARDWLAKMKKEGYKAALIDAPLLYESGFDKECDTVIALLASKETRVLRIIERDGIDEAAALARINAQPSDDFYKERADFTVYNDADGEALEKKAIELLSLLGLL